MQIRTPRLLLRELTLDDGVALNRIETDERVARFMTFLPPTLEQTRAYIAKGLADREATPRSVWDFGIVRHRDDRRGDAPLVSSAPAEELIGRCGLKISRPEHLEAMIWYLLQPACWGRGYAFEATAGVVSFGFEQLGLHRIWADCDPRNRASCRLAERLGMTFEGRLRENYFLKGEWCDTAVYAILDRDWSASRAVKHSDEK